MTLLSTGEAARQLQVSVRTLRYYDQIGLAEPSRKDDYGKRFYSEEDMVQLEKILLLKSLSLSLEDSRKVLLENSTHSILTAHKSALEQQFKEIDHSISQTNSLLHTLKIENTIDWKMLLKLVVKKADKQNWQHYFNQEENLILADRLPKLESANITTKKWMNLLKRIELCIQAKESPKSETAQLIIEDIELLSMETFNGDEQLMEKFWEVRKSPEASEELGLYPINEKIIHFLNEAMSNAESA
ncbi:MerR family transcriptional regulator [Jeotgalibacillus sp. S-D1]|uniref:MerR family transcriptional regulator n=1 Tax=Jeotgalibacillus sp. S-D1 TaxID=2552189 RepID=UPI001059E3F1|nr:MerR family transcriptional regulator [Jeotgalibacillus sp. S-D1]TDL30931.1 MerR family transcriptional regulator [Jeotgalibacillus sp. S-D1]